MTAVRCTPGLAMVALLGGCGPAVSAATGGSGSGGGGGTTTTSTTASTSTRSTTTTTTSGPSTTTGPGETTGGTSGTTTGPTADTGCLFGCAPDGGSAIECSVWDQDCPPGHKCAAWANDGTSWDAAKCVPVAPMPSQPSEPCVVEGSGVSGVDDCALGSMCWNVDPGTNEGTCVALCDGTSLPPTCAGFGTVCVVANGELLELCLPDCDPFGQDCPAGQGCAPVGWAVACLPDASGGAGAYGDPCRYADACDPGLACIGSTGVPGCTDPFGCCSTLCDLSDPSADASCPGAAGGQTCKPAFAVGMAPMGHEGLGVCSSGGGTTVLLLGDLVAPG